MNKKIIAATLFVFMIGSVIVAAPVKKQLKLTKNVVAEAEQKQLAITTKKSETAKLLENLRYDDAKINIEDLLKENSEDLDANIYYNTYLINKKRLNEAQDNIDELLAKHPESSDLHFLQGLIYLKRPETSDMSYRSNSDFYFENGVSELKKAIETDKTNYKAYNALGVAQMSAGNLDEAENNFKEAIKLKQDYATAYDNLGTLYYQQGNYEIAENRFNEAVARNPYCFTANYHLARLSAKNGEYSTALTFLEKALLINPSFAYAYNLAGEIYAKQLNEAAAIVNYKKAIELSPEYTTPYMNLAKLYENRADNEFALESLKTVVGMDKNTDTICLKIADIELAKGNFAQAEKYYSSIPETSEYRDEAIKGLAETYWMEAQEMISKAPTNSVDKMYQAREKLNSAIKTRPEDIELRLAKLKLDKLIGAEISDTEFQEIFATTPTTAAEFVVKGEAYSVENEFILAKSEFENALTAANNINEYKYLAEYFTYTKNYEMALASLTEAEKINPTDRQVTDNKRFVNAKINKSEEFLSDAIYFKKEGDKFFTKKYLVRAVEENPANIEANKLLAKFYKKSKNLKAECACYKQIVAASDELKEQKKFLKKVTKLEKKIQKLANKQTLWQKLFG